MIEHTKAYKVGENTFSTLELAQRYELETMLKGTTDLSLQSVCAWIVDNGDKVMDVLTTGPRSKPRARKINGGAKTRKPKTQEPAQA